MIELLQRDKKPQPEAEKQREDGLRSMGGSDRKQRWWSAELICIERGKLNIWLLLILRYWLYTET